MNFIRRDITRLQKTLDHRADSEHEQTLIRIGISVLMLVWFAIAPHTGLLTNEKSVTNASFLFVILYLAISCLSFLSVLKRPEVNVNRRILWMIIDPIILGVIFIAAGAVAIPLMFVFIWLPIDNGFRYGRRYLYFSLALSFVAFGYILCNEKFWENHVLIGAGIAFEMALLCSYTTIPLKRLNDANERLCMMATRDPLTNLANRHLFIEHLKNAIALTERNEKYCACVFIDLDGFKKVNDNYGHAVGDLLLIEVARRIKGCLRDTDLVARLGGDEFAVAAQCFQVPVDAVMVSERILKSLQSINDINGNPVSISGSIGVSWYQYNERFEMSVDALIDNADNAMYEAKRAGKNRMRVVGPDGIITVPDLVIPKNILTSTGEQQRRRNE